MMSQCINTTAFCFQWQEVQRFQELSFIFLSKQHIAYSLYIKPITPVMKVSLNMWYHRYELANYLHPLTSCLCMYKAWSFECETLSVCMYASWALRGAVCSAASVVHRANNLSDRLISSSNTNGNETQQRHRNGVFSSRMSHQRRRGVSAAEEQ